MISRVEASSGSQASRTRVTKDRCSEDVDPVPEKNGVLLDRIKRTARHSSQMAKLMVAQHDSQI